MHGVPPGQVRICAKRLEDALTYLSCDNVVKASEIIAVVIDAMINMAAEASVDKTSDTPA